jgi:hypothetical protein
LLGLGFGAPGTVDAANIGRAFITDIDRALLTAALMSCRFLAAEASVDPPVSGV